MPPVQVLKGVLQGKHRATAVRNGLVILQFAVSITFLTGTFVITRQMRFVRTMNLGFDKTNVLVIPVRDESALTRIDAMEHEISGLPEVVSVAATSFKPGSGVFRQNYWREGMDSSQHPMIAWISIDQGFLKTLGLKLEAGRDFSREYRSDSGQAYILNESAVKELGWPSPQEAIGKPFKIVDRGVIVGVVKNFNFNSLYSKIEPLVLCVYKPAFAFLYVRIRPGRIFEASTGLRKIWQDFALHQEFEYVFLDDELDTYYETDFRLGRIFTGVTAASILIAILGLLGLAALSARARTKEIGIRKILGASTAGIVRMLAFDFSRLALVANILAWPAAYYVMNRWLRSFAYRTPIGWWVFIAAGGLTFGIALLIVSWQSLSIVRTNPTKSLRYE